MGSSDAVVCGWRKCSRPLPTRPPEARGPAPKYCGKGHQQNEYRARKKDKEWRTTTPVHPLNVTRTTEEESVAADGRAQSRRPPDDFLEEADYWGVELSAKRITQAEIAKRFDTNQANISRWFAWIREEALLERDREGWQRPEEAVRALNDFPYFRARYFKVARPPFKGMPYVTKPFHLRWVVAILGILPALMGGTRQDEDGGQLEILSPPRHGKTELLIHLCIWLILRNPDIAIIWIAKSEGRAKEAGAMIRGELERNKLLREEMLGPGGSFVPMQRTGDAWRNDEFSVGTRTAVNKAPTFRAFGKGGTLQSVDADLIVNDDVEDHDSTRTPDQRAKNLDWLLTEVESRKERHTAQLYIGSRNHPQDIAAHLEKSDDWETIVESAHMRDCDIDPHDEAAHTDCMLWPEKFPYSELAKKYRNSGEAIVEMRYQNSPKSEGVIVFPEEMLRECLDRSRVMGNTIDLPPGYELLGVCDPSPGIHQVGTIIAWSRDNPTRYLVDVHKGRGGMDAWQDLVASWLETYGLRRWVTEDNSFQVDYINKREFVEWCREKGVFVEGFTTGTNRNSLGIGVVSIRPVYANREFVIPYGDDQSQAKAEAWIREHKDYDPDAPRSARRRFDRLMCAWIGNKRIDQLRASAGGGSDAVDEAPSFLTPGGIGWLEDDMVGGWLQ